ncbi:MAG: replicative DNA helicase [Planctomycetes bacterium]|nr:replicative DNA helicase [Planctomycetota bacterium]
MSDQNGSERLPPQSRDAERCVLGSMLRDNQVINEVVQIVREDNFYFDAHRKIFRTMTELNNLGKPSDLIILAESLKSQGFIEDIGGYSYLAELWEAAPTAANAEYYAHIVREKGIIRNLIHTSTEILRDAYDQIQPADELLARAEREVLDISEKGFTGATSTLQQAINEAYARLDARKKGGGVDSGVPTGFVDLDVLTAGMQNNELIILAARPSVGKTAFALNIVRHVVVEEKIPVFFVSLEQARIELAERLLVAQARVDSSKLRKATLNSEEMQRILEAGGIMHKAKLFIDDSPSQSMMRIAANARRLKLREGIRMVVIDYLQLIDPENRRDPRQEQVAQISRRLKFLARDLKMPVIALAQVNRTSEDRQDNTPRLSDLRESGSIEQDADTVFMLHRKPIVENEAGHTDYNIQDIEVIVAKQRNGPTGEVTLAYRKDFMRFENKAISPHDSFGS